MKTCNKDVRYRTINKMIEYMVISKNEKLNLLSLFRKKKPSCFSLMKRTPSFSNLCDGCAASLESSFLLNRILPEPFTAWNKKEDNELINMGINLDNQVNLFL